MTRIHLYIALIAIGLWSCETPYLPPDSGRQSELVVEGYVESGSGTAPTYVVLTRSFPFVGTIDSSVFSSLLVDDAVVTVTDGSGTVELSLVCIEDLPPLIQEQIKASLQTIDGFESFCAYVDILDEIDRRPGGQYALNIDWQGKTYSSITSIPMHVPLYDLYFKEPAGFTSDTLAELRTSISDPGGRPDYYRYFTRVVPRPYTSGIASVIDDGFFDGDEFEFTVNRHSYQDEEIDTRSIGLFTRGDSISIRWCNMDEDHFNFWNTLEFNNQNQGPFSSFTRVDGNVAGALGIWGGYSISEYRLRVPEF